MFPLGNIRQPLIADDLYQFVRGVSVEGEVAPDHRSPFTVLHLGVGFSRKRCSRSGAPFWRRNPPMKGDKLRRARKRA
jgi:hypothetical protein